MLDPDTVHSFPINRLPNELPLMTWPTGRVGFACNNGVLRIGDAVTLAAESNFANFGIVEKSRNFKDGTTLLKITYKPISKLPKEVMDWFKKLSAIQYSQTEIQ